MDHGLSGGFHRGYWQYAVVRIVRDEADTSCGWVNGCFAASEVVLDFTISAT